MITFTDSRTNKTYTFTNTYVPQSRISQNCEDGTHSMCTFAPQHMIKFVDADLTKQMCCLCTCHSN